MNISSDEEVAVDETHTVNKLENPVERQVRELTDKRMSERELMKFEKKLKSTYEP